MRDLDDLNSEVQTYFEGLVNSRDTNFRNQAATKWQIAPGSYDFRTVRRELVVVLSGSMQIKFDNEHSWRVYSARSKLNTLEIPAGADFTIITAEGLQCVGISLNNLNTVFDTWRDEQLQRYDEIRRELMMWGF